MRNLLPRVPSAKTVAGTTASCWSITLIAADARGEPFFRRYSSRSPSSCSIKRPGVAKLGWYVGAHEGSSNR